jgi:orotate phosphoribosyltransferase
MALDLPSMLRETGALLQGHFRLSSGLHSRSYVQCALLLENPSNAVAIGEELASRIRSMKASKIVAPALGGVIIGYTVAQALDVPFIFTERKGGDMTLRRGFHIEAGEPLLIVEDVVTTGKSTRETAAVLA